MAGDELAIWLSSGVGFDLENPQNRQAADSFYETAYSQAVRAGESEELLSQVVSMVAKTGYLPPRVARDATGLLLGNDGSRQIKGAELYGELRGAQTGIRAVVIDHPLHGRMMIRQQEDIPTERHIGRDVTFWDPEKRQNVTEKPPNSRFFVRVDDGRDASRFDICPICLWEDDNVQLGNPDFTGGANK